MEWGASLHEEVDPLLAVRQSTAQVVEEASNVSIDKEAVRSLAAAWVSGGGLRALLQDDIGWAKCGWHFAEDAALAGPLTCQYVFVLDALNFCFWPTDGLEYEHLAVGIRQALLRDPAALSADRLASVTEETLNSWIPSFQIPLLGERVRKLRELGAVLSQHFGGEAAQMVACAGRSAARLVRIVVSMLPGFRDETVYRGRQVFFYKRAQILVSDLWAAYGQKGPDHKYGFSDMGALTMFADYRVPQILVHLAVLGYSERLQGLIAARAELLPGSEEEVEIRAATVQAVEMLREALLSQGEGVLTTSVEIDWILWHQGEKMKDDIVPHHRTRTPFY